MLDLGEHSISELPQAGVDTLDTKVVPATISCAQKMRFMLSFTDNRFDSRASDAGLEIGDVNGLFGLGKSAEDIHIGGYKLSMNNLISDGTGRVLISSTDKSTWANNDRNILYSLNSGANEYYGFSDPKSPLVTTAENYSFNMNVTPYLSSQLNGIVNSAVIDGSVSMMLEYF